MNDNLYELLFPDSDDDADIGRIRVNDIFSNLENDEISKYMDITLYNRSFTDNDDSSLSVIHFNIRNFLSNKDELLAILSMMTRTPDIICLSETWLDTSNEMYAKIDGFIAYNVIRESPRGGVSIFVRDSIKSNFIPQFSFVRDELEICTITVTFNNTDYTISAIYRPHFKYDNIKEFRKVLEPILGNKLFKKSKTVLTGDLNINLLEHHSHSDTKDFLSFMQNHFYLPLITRPTRFPEGLQRAAPSLLDHIYVNFSPPAVSGILKLHITDHLPVFLTFVIPEDSSQNYKIKFRVFKDDSRIRFSRDLALIIWEELLTSQDLNTNYDIFNRKLGQLYNSLFPVVTKIISKKRISHPWITPFLIASINNKNNAYQRFKTGLLSWEEFRAIRNRTNSIRERSHIT